MQIYSRFAGFKIAVLFKQLFFLLLTDAEIKAFNWLKALFFCLSQQIKKSAKKNRFFGTHVNRYSALSINIALQYYQQATCYQLNGLRDKQQILFIASQSLRCGESIA